MATLQKGKHLTPRYLIKCFLNRSPENTVCSDMEGERDPSVKSSGQEGQGNNFRNGERFPCSLQGGEEYKAVHFRQLWVSPTVLITAKLLRRGRASYTRTSCCCYIFSTVWFEIPLLRFPQQQILRHCRIHTSRHCINTVLFNEAAKSVFLLVTTFRRSIFKHNLYQSTGVICLPLVCSG